MNMELILSGVATDRIMNFEDPSTTNRALPASLVGYFMNSSGASWP